MQDVLRVVYIVGVGHSGSTLLDLLISSTPGVSSVGEMHYLTAQFEVGNCMCGTSYQDCPAWAASYERYTTATDLPEDTREMRSFLAATRSTIVVDSSKGVKRMCRLLRGNDISLQPMYLYREGQGVLHSRLKKRPPRSNLEYVWRVVQLTIDFIVRHLYTIYRLHQTGVEYQLVTYQSLTTNTEIVVRQLGENLGIPIPSAVAVDIPRHNIGGNRMRTGSTFEIRYNDAWKRELPMFAKVIFQLLGGGVLNTLVRRRIIV